MRNKIKEESGTTKKLKYKLEGLYLYIYYLILGTSHSKLINNDKNNASWFMKLVGSTVVAKSSSCFSTKGKLSSCKCDKCG